MYEAVCSDCGHEMTIHTDGAERFCPECEEMRQFDAEREVQKYTVVIAVDGDIDGKRVSGVVGHSTVAGDEQEAERQAVSEFRDDPAYNTDVSVNKRRFPDGEYLDNWGYDKFSARAVHVEPADDLSTLDVKWRRFGEKV